MPSRIPSMSSSTTATRRIRERRFAAVLAGVLAIGGAEARDLFRLTAQSGGSTAIRGFSNAEAFIDQMSNAGLSEMLFDYDPLAETFMTLDVRGLPATARYPEDSPTLLFDVPSLDIALSFDGATRDESQEFFLDFLKGAGGSILTRLLQGLVSETAVDPVAGNPNSLVASSASADFAATASGAFSAQWLGVGFGVGRSTATGFTTTQYGVPLQWNRTLRGHPGTVFLVDMPIRYLDVEGGSIYDGSLGLGVDVLVVDKPTSPALRWSLTPSLRAGLVGSEDLGAFQAVYSAALKSALQHARGDYLFTLNNMVGLYNTGGIGRSFSGDYELQNTIYKNGLALESTWPKNWWPRGSRLLGDDPVSWEVHVVNTQVTGDPWFVSNYNEVAFTVGTRRRSDREDWRVMRLGAKYTFADNFDALHLLLSYRF